MYDINEIKRKMKLVNRLELVRRSGLSSPTITCIATKDGYDPKQSTLRAVKNAINDIALDLLGKKGITK